VKGAEVLVDPARVDDWVHGTAGLQARSGM